MTPFRRTPSIRPSPQPWRLRVRAGAATDAPAVERRPWRRAALLALAVAASPVGCAAPGGPRLADRVVEAAGEGGAPYRDPALATNGVRGGGAEAQSLDVYSIRFGERLVLAWSNGVVMDGPGADLVVFENAFVYGERGETFMDPAVVEVSADGERWVAFPHDYVAEDERAPSAFREDWRGFAGLSPVGFDSMRGGDPFDAPAGGDRFDLAELDDAVLRRSGIRFVRLSAAADHDNPDTGAPFPRDPVSDGVDVDGVFARWVEPDVENAATAPGS